MPRSARPTFACAATLIALAMQWCLPLAHAVHQAAHAAAPHAHQHHDHHDHREEPGAPKDPRDESQCPSCQQLVLLRAFTPPDAPLTLVALESIEFGAADGYEAPSISHVHRSPAAPRGPPVR